MRLEAPRQVDDRVGEFWLENPFDFERLRNFNLSMYERNRLFLSRGRGVLVDASHLSATDHTSDSRAVAVGDLDEDGRPDLIVRSVGGGPLRVFLNRIRGGRSLHVTLRGTRSNTDGIGARMVLQVGDRKLRRDHFPQNSLLSQNANETIFGLGNHRGPFELTIRWPSGTVQVLGDLEPGRIRVVEPDEGSGSDD